MREEVIADLILFAVSFDARPLSVDILGHHPVWQTYGSSSTALHSSAQLLACAALRSSLRFAE